MVTIRAMSSSGIGDSDSNGSKMLEGTASEMSCARASAAVREEGAISTAPRKRKPENSRQPMTTARRADTREVHMALT